MTDQPRLDESVVAESRHEDGAQCRDYVDDLIAWVARIGRAILPVLFAFSLVALGFYLFKGYIPDFHSDSAVKNLLAEEVLREGRYFPHDWNYVNGDLWVMFGQVFIIPLLPFFPNGFTLHGVSGLISSTILLLSLWWSSAMIIRSRWIRLLVITIFAGGVHWIMAEHLFGQVSYGNVLFLCALTLFSGWRLLESKRTVTTAAWAAAFAVVSLLTFWGNPQRAAAYDFLPMSAAVLAWLWSRDDLLKWMPGARRWSTSPELRRAIMLGALMCFSAAVGTFLHSNAIANVNNAEGAGSARWLSFEGFLTNLKFTIIGILGTFGALPQEGGSVMSAGGVYRTLRFCSILTLLVIIPFAAARFLRGASPSARMFAGFTISGLLMFVFLQITTTTPDMSGPIISARYMVPSLVLAVVMLAGYAEQNGIRSVGGFAAWGVLLVLASSLVDPANAFARIYRGVPPAPHQSQADELEKRGLSYGYATFWNANVISVLSEGNVRVRPVLLQDGLPAPHRHLASDHWYRSSAWDGSTFLMLAPGEMTLLNRDRLEHAVGAPVDRFFIDDLEVLVFSGNIASELRGWDKSSVGGSFDAAITSTSRHEIGALEILDNVPALRADAGAVGFLHFGPYLPLAAGSYELTVEVDSEVEGEAGRLEMVSNSGSEVLAQTPITGGTSAITLPVVIARDLTQVEIRVFSNGKGAMLLRAMDLRPVNDGASRISLPSPDTGKQGEAASPAAAKTANVR